MKKITFIGAMIAIVLSFATSGFSNIFSTLQKDSLFTYSSNDLDSLNGFQPAIRIFTLGEHQEIEAKNMDGKWRLIQIKNTSSGIITNYRNRKFVDYSRELKGGIVAHYNTHRAVKNDTEGEKADFYTKADEDKIYTYYFDSLTEVINNQPVKRVFVDGSRLESEAKNASGKLKH